MAKIKFGMMMTDARGKLGGQVFSKNRSGAYVRTKVTPVNPRTSFQQANRSLLGTLSSLWSNLTESQRSAWNSAVESWQKTNVFGDLQKPTGKNLFTGLNKNRLFHFPSLAYQTLPPAKVEFPAFSIVSGVYGVGATGLLVTLSGAVTETNDFRVRATPLLSTGTTYVQNQLRSLEGIYSVDETNVLNLTFGYVERFGGASAGFVVGVEVTPIAENGQLGVPSVILITTTV